MSDQSAHNGRRALLLGRPPAETDGVERASDFVEFLLGAGWRVSFASATPTGDPELTRDLRQRGVPVYDGTDADFATVLRERSFDVAICTSWDVAELYLEMLREACTQTGVIVDAPRLQLVRHGRRAFADAHTAHPPVRLVDELGSETAGEMTVYASVDAVLTASTRGAGFVNMLLGAERAICVPDAFAPRSVGAPLGERSGMVVAGVLPDPDCLEAVELLRREVVPRLKAADRKDQPISIIGDGPLSASARQDPSLVVSGPVARRAAILSQARLAVMPVYSSVDSRMLVQSAACGTPLVATSAVLGDLELEPGRHALAADTPAEIAAAIGRLLVEDELWHALSEAARAHLEPAHGRAGVSVRFLEAIELAISHRSSAALTPLPSGRDTFAHRQARRQQRAIAPAVGEIVRTAVPAEAKILVLSGGSDELLRLGVRDVTHFPRPAPHSARSMQPAASDEMVDGLKREIGSGAQFLVIPETAHDWLSAYPGFSDYLRDTFAARQEGVCTIVPLRDVSHSSLAAKLIAFYLPQFHPTPENDEAWGTGFTEWRNVGRASPLFPGHYQPHVPGELGFYDLRLPETRAAQAKLAADAGVHAFCYYHYWFAGKRLLARPFDEVLASGEPDFPFCLCWANEPWSRRWDGSEDEVIQPQAYSLEDDREHIRWLLPALSDRRAVTVDGKPVFLVYRPWDLPDLARTVDLWRQEVRAAGLNGLYLIGVEGGGDSDRDLPRCGFDASVRFQPQFSVLESLPRSSIDGADALRVWDYEASWPALARAEQVSHRRYETVCAGWDNSPRTARRGWLLHNSTPDAYGRWLRHAIDDVQGYPPEERLVFLNAWNEWGEGAHLEPDRRYGQAYLDATRAAVVRTMPRERGAMAVPAKAPPARSGTSSRQAEADGPPRREARARAVAFYLPQFHPTPENDEFWGPGFTEWTNVVQAKPLFEGHQQPQVPSHLGLYDLRVPEVREAQAELARTHGIEAFCYWHYWFAGRRPLSAPLDAMIASGRPEFPFCLAWANEPWSRTWLGEDTDVLIESRYSAPDDLEHARWLAGVFADPRYLTVLGRPVFVVYRPTHLPDSRRFTDNVRQACAWAGVADPLLLGTTAWDGLDHRALGFDGTIEFEPRLGVLEHPSSENLNVYDYAAARSLMKSVRNFPVYPSVVVGWDNTPRRGAAGTVLTGASPAALRAAISNAVAYVGDRPPAERLVFVNAWNEWGEGNRLEPEERYGFGYLKAVRDALLGDWRGWTVTAQTALEQPDERT